MIDMKYRVVAKQPIVADVEADSIEEAKKTAEQVLTMGTQSVTYGGGTEIEITENEPNIIKIKKGV